jgi:hypothetical protein
MGRRIIHCCVNCDWFTTAVNSGLCTNPDSKKCGELVGGCSEYCEEWTKKVERETTQIESQKPMTNADRIRAMSDEELASWAKKQIGCGAGFFPCGVVCNGKCEAHSPEACRTLIMEWLKQPAEEQQCTNGK